MSLTIKVLRCDGQCKSCYEERIRSVNKCDYSVSEILKTIKENEGEFSQITIHGGEPLTLLLRDFEEIIRFNFQKKGFTGIQTNLYDLKDEHIDYFKKYKTNVGISIDGDTGNLNYGRWNKNDDAIKNVHTKTLKTINNIKKLHKNNIKMSIITVLRKYNAKNSELNKLMSFIKQIHSEFGIIDFRMNPLITFDKKQQEVEELTANELSNALCKLADFSFTLPEIRMFPFIDIIDMLMGHNNSSCNFQECDPWHTTAEVCVLPFGGIGGCLKSGASLDGIQAPRSDQRLQYRYEMLKNLAKTNNGCRYCEFWHICKGGCPGAAIDNDFRNRTRFCQSNIKLFKHISQKIKILFPNIHLLPDFYPYRPSQKEIFESITGSTWQQRHFQPIEKIKKKIESQKNKACETKNQDPGHQDNHTDQHTDQHEDIPHDDHWDTVHPNKRRN